MTRQSESTSTTVDAPVMIATDRITDGKQGGRLRTPRAARVAAVTASIAAEGQKTPLEVSPVGAAADGRYVLTTGLVRLEALRALGLDALCVVKRASADVRRRRDLDDNLLGSGTLTRMERMRALALRKALYEADHPETGNGKSRHPSKMANLASFEGRSDQMAKFANWSDGAPRFRTWAAAAYGLSERTVADDVAVGATLDPTACALLTDHAVAEQPGQLAQLAALDPETQRAVAGLMTRQDDPAPHVQAALNVLNERAIPAQMELFDRFSARIFPGYWARLATHKRREFTEQFVRTVPRAWVEAALAAAANDEAANDAA